MFLIQLRINRIDRLLSKGMSNIYLKVTFGLFVNLSVGTSTLELELEMQLELELILQTPLFSVP